MQPQLEKLKNNLNTLFVHAEGSTSATVQIWFKAGSSLERPEEHGIAHFLEHMFFKGTKKRPSHLLAKEIESFGGEINAFTSFDYTCYYINCPNDRIKDSCDALMDMISNPTFKQSELVPEKGVVLEEYKRTIDSPSQYSFYKIQKKFLSGKYSHPILGKVKTINSFTQTQLKEFRKNYYNNQNSILVVAGDLNDKTNIKKQIEKYKLPNGKKSTFPKLTVKNQNEIQVFHNDVTMCELTIIIPSPSYEENTAPCEEIAMGCIGHGETSLLYKELVLNSGICHSAYASTLFVENGGIHLIRINFPYQNLNKSLMHLSKVLLKTISSGIASEDICKIKNQYVASKIFEKESIESYAFSLGHSYTSSNNIFSEDLFINKIKNSKESDIVQSFRDILSRPIQVSLQIPNEDNLKTTQKAVQLWFSNLRSLTSNINKKKIKTIYSNNKSKFDPNAQVVSISPGIKLLYRYNSLTPTFSMQAYIKGGLTDETKDNNGVYSQLSSLLTYGHKKKPYQKLRMYLEETCSSLNGFAGKNAYGISMKGLSENFHELSSHFFNSIINPTLPDKYLSLEKKMAIRSLKSQEEDPVKQCFNTISEITFKNHPYSMNIIGNEQSIKGLTTKKIKDLHNKNLKEKEILISYSGDLDLQTVRSQITPLISTLAPRKKTKTIKKKSRPSWGANIHIPFDREQTHIFLGIPTGPLVDSNNLILKIITTLFSGQSSELFVNIRDKQGLCYSISPISFSALEYGYWGIYMACSNSKVNDAVHSLESFIDKIKKKGISKQEFNQAKKMIIGQSMLSLQTNEDFLNTYSVPELHDLGIDYHYETIEQINSIKYTIFNDQLKVIFSNKFNKIIVGSDS